MVSASLSLLLRAPYHPPSSLPPSLTVEFLATAILNKFFFSKIKEGSINIKMFLARSAFPLNLGQLCGKMKQRLLWGKK